VQPEARSKGGNKVMVLSYSSRAGLRRPLGF
jgi:hypothetical protein